MTALLVADILLYPQFFSSLTSLLVRHTQNIHDRQPEHTENTVCTRLNSQRLPLEGGVLIGSLLREALPPPKTPKPRRLSLSTTKKNRRLSACFSISEKKSGISG